MILPSKAEESEVESQQRRHHVSDERTGFTGMEEETKPEGRQQSAELTDHKVYLQTETHLEVRSFSSSKASCRPGESQ